MVYAYRLKLAISGWIVLHWIEITYVQINRNV